MATRILIVLTTLGVLVGALCAGAAFNSLFFRRFLSGIAEGRLLAVAVDTRDAFARSVALGLPLAQFEGVAQLAEQARRADPAIVAIHVYQSGPADFTALSLDETGGAGTPLPPDWAQAVRRNPQAAWWSIESPAGIGVLIPVTSAFGTTIGLVAMLQDRSVTAAPQHRFDLHLAGLAALVGLPAALGLVVLMRRLTGSALGNLPGWLAHVEDPHVPPPQPDPADLVGTLIGPGLAELRRRAAP